MTPETKNRLAALLGLVGVLAGAGCGSDRPTSPAFELGVDEVACELVYGSSTGSAIGPLTPGNTETIEINSYTEVRIGLSASDLVVAVDREIATMHASFALEEIPDEGIPFEGLWIDDGHPGYRITCFRG